MRTSFNSTVPPFYIRALFIELNTACTLKILTCESLLAQPSTSSEMFWARNVTHAAWINSTIVLRHFPTVSPAGIVSPRWRYWRRHVNKSIIGKFLSLEWCSQNTKILFWGSYRFRIECVIWMNMTDKELCKKFKDFKKNIWRQT